MGRWVRKADGSRAWAVGFETWPTPEDHAADLERQRFAKAKDAVDRQVAESEAVEQVRQAAGDERKAARTADRLARWMAAERIRPGLGDATIHRPYGTPTTLPDGRTWPPTPDSAA